MVESCELSQQMYMYMFIIFNIIYNYNKYLNVIYMYSDILIVMVPLRPKFSEIRGGESSPQMPYTIIWTNPSSPSLLTKKLINK